MMTHILKLIPEHSVYTEVFFGGGAVFFAKKPSFNETINDNYDVAVNFYKVLKLRYRQLKKLIDASLISRTEHQRALKIIRGHQSRATDVELAWAFWQCTNFAYSNKIGGGPKYSNNQFTVVPDTLKRKKERFTELLAKRIEHAYIEHEDALKILHSRNVSGAFHYIDPPYLGTDQGHYSGYSVEDFTRLLDFLSNDLKGKFLLSNYNSEILDEYIAKNNWHKKEIKFRIKAPRKPKNTKIEVLVWNYDLNGMTLEMEMKYNE